MHLSPKLLFKERHMIPGDPKGTYIMKTVADLFRCISPAKECTLADVHFVYDGTAAVYLRIEAAGAEVTELLWRPFLRTGEDRHELVQTMENRLQHISLLTSHRSTQPSATKARSKFASKTVPRQHLQRTASRRRRSVELCLSSCRKARHCFPRLPNRTGSLDTQTSAST